MARVSIQNVETPGKGSAFPGLVPCVNLLGRGCASAFSTMPTISRDSLCLSITSVARDRLPVFRTDLIKSIVCAALDEGRRSEGRGFGKAEPFRTAAEFREANRRANSRRHTLVPLKLDSAIFWQNISGHLDQSFCLCGCGRRFPRVQLLTF